MVKTIYLANPYGFSQQQKATLLPPIVASLESLGLEVWEPFARNNQENFSEAAGPTGLAKRISRMWSTQMASSPWSTAFRPTRE